MNVDYRYEDMTIVLVQRSLKKLGAIGNIDRTSIQFNLNLNSADELSFSVLKNMDDNVEALWDEIYSLRIVYCVEIDKYFQIDVNEVDCVNPMKNITGTALCESELSQIMLYTIEINTEIDIARDDYVVTKFYNPSNPKGSLLHRILEKAPHYEIKYVDDTLWDLQRQFSIDGQSIYDFLQGSCAEQFNCIFKYVVSAKDNKRYIYVYDLYTVCMNDDCEYLAENGRRYRSNITHFLFGEKFKCPYCNENNLKYYGEDTEIYVDVENLTNEIQYETQADQTKNSFKLVAGDDNMTAAVINQNPNGTDYLYYFSDEMKHDMSEELSDALALYDETYDYYDNDYVMNFNEDDVDEYNRIIEKYYDLYYAQTEKELIYLDNPVVGYKNLAKHLYNCVDLGTYLKDVLMPVAETAEINAKTERTALQLAYSTGKMQTIALPKLTSSTVASTVEKQLVNVAKLYVKSGYVKVEAITTSWNYSVLNPYGVWVGNFRITNYSDRDDVTETYNMGIKVSKDYDLYMKDSVQVLLLDTLKDNKDYFDVVNYDITYGNLNNEYSSIKPYKIGDWVTRQEGTDVVYYQCIVNIPVCEAWTSYHWKEIEGYDSEKVYDIGDYVYDYFVFKGKEVKSLWRRINQAGKTTPPSLYPQYWEYGNIDNQKLNHYKVDILSKYCQKRLESFYDATQGCMKNLTDIAQPSHEMYQWIYYPLLLKSEALMEVLNERNRDINFISGEYNANKELLKDGMYQYMVEYRESIKDSLNMKSYLIERGLYDEFCSFRREDKYENSSYISTNLNNEQQFERAKEFLERASEEVVKAALPKHTITATLDNLFSMDEFEPLRDKFELGNWIRVKVDEDVFRLRLIAVSFNLNDFKTINVEFSDASKANGVIDDIQSILDQTKSMASSYGYIQNQASAAEQTTETVDSFKDDGIDFSDYTLTSSDKGEVVLDANGILLRKYDETTGDYYPEQVRLTNNNIIFTNDYWATIKAGLGRSTYHYYGVDEEGISELRERLQALIDAGVEPDDPEYIAIEEQIAELSVPTMREGTGYGLNSDFVESGYVYGSQIIGGEVFSTNYVNTEEIKQGSYINLDEGIFDFAGGKIIFDGKQIFLNFGKEDNISTEHIEDVDATLEALKERGLTHLTYTNQTAVTIRDGENEKRIIHFEYQTNEADFTFHAMIKCEVDTTTTTVDDNTTFNDCKVKATMKVNGSTVQEKPVETWSDGEHIFSIDYIYTTSLTTSGTFDVYFSTEGGDITIKAYQINSYLETMGSSGGGEPGEGGLETITLTDTMNSIAMNNGIVSVANFQTALKVSTGVSNRNIRVPDVNYNSDYVEEITSSADVESLVLQLKNMYEQEGQIEIIDSGYLASTRFDDTNFQETIYMEVYDES